MLGVVDYPAFAGAVWVFLAIPGPGNVALLSATAHGGRRGGLAATLGVIVGDQVLMWAAVAGLAAVLKASALLFSALQWVGAIYLGYLGLQMIRANAHEPFQLDMSSGRYFRQAFFITLLNPKAIIFYMAFFPLFLDPQAPPSWMTFVLMALTVAGLTWLYGAGLTLAAHHVAGRMQRFPRLGSWLQRLAGAAILGFGLRLVFIK